MTENEQWKKLCQYVEKEILGYDDTQHIQKNAVLKLRGLKNGKVYANNKTENNGVYSYECILNTFIICRGKILNAFQGKDFEDESGKVGYACAIVRNNINTMAERMKRAEREQSRVESIDTSIITSDKAEYKIKSKVTKKFDDMW